MTANLSPYKIYGVSEQNLQVREINRQNLQ